MGGGGRKEMRTEGTKVLRETRCKRPKGKKGKGANGGIWGCGQSSG